MLLQPSSQLQGTGGLRLHPDMQRFHSLEQNPGIERAECRSRVAHKRQDLLINVLAVGHNRASQYPALAIQIFSGRVNDDIGAKLNRALQRRAAKTIVHHQYSTRTVGNAG